MLSKTRKSLYIATPKNVGNDKLYTPGLFYLKRKFKGCKPPPLFPIASTLILNAPAGLIILWQTGRTMRSSEAVSFTVIFLVMGFLSGIGFVWRCDDAGKR